MDVIEKLCQKGFCVRITADADANPSNYEVIVSKSDESIHERYEGQAVSEMYDFLNEFEKNISSFEFIRGELRSRAIDIAEEMYEILLSENDTTWCRWLQYVIHALKFDDNPAITIQSVYQGAGSFNDFVLGLDYQIAENVHKMNKLDELRQKLYDCSVKMRESKT